MQCAVVLVVAIVGLNWLMSLSKESHQGQTSILTPQLAFQARGGLGAHGGGSVGKTGGDKGRRPKRLARESKAVTDFIRARVVRGEEGEGSEAARRAAWSAGGRLSKGEVC